MKGRKKKRTLGFKACSILFTGMTLVFGFITCKQYVCYKNLQAEEEIIRQEIDNEMENRMELNKKLAERSNDEYIEEFAREQFGFVKSDEIIFQIDDEQV